MNFGQLAEPDHQSTSFMQHFVFFVGSFLIFSVNGFVVILASTGRNLSYPELLAAPVVGTCVLSILVTVLYFWGVPPYVTTVSGTVISAAIIAGKFSWRVISLALVWLPVPTSLFEFCALRSWSA
jgi:hypothetical protein